MGLRGVDWNIVIKGNEGLSWSGSDFFAIEYGAPTYDMEQNTVLTTTPSRDTSNHTLASWTRPLDSCDMEDIPVFLDVERSVVWAYSYTADWDKAKLNFTNYVRGIKTGIKFYASANSTAPLPADAQMLTVAMPNYPVPAANNTVACINVPLPNATAYHVISYQGFNTTPFVARVAGYVCAAGLTPTAQAPYVPYMCEPFQSATSQRSKLPLGCETLNFVWAPGALAFTAPPQAGFAIGAGAATTMVLQVYYQNPRGVMNMVDSSGLNLTYTAQLRNATLGVLTVGNTDLRIQPQNDSYDALPNICPAACTAKQVVAPVILVSNFYVMGRLGSSTRTRHIRTGQALQPVGRINYWDKKYMGFQGAFPGSTQLLPNDTLISLCTYNSTTVPIGRTTTFGLNMTNELCFNYITFYPATAMPGLDYCVADTRKNVSTCSSRSYMAMLETNTTNQLGKNLTTVPVGTLSIPAYKSAQCQLHDQDDVVPTRPPNTKAAVASIVLVPIVLIFVGVILWTKYTKQEELEALLAQARQEGLAT